MSNLKYPDASVLTPLMTKSSHSVLSSTLVIFR
jgi:hypothetical protein